MKTKQWDGDAPLALQGLRGLERIDAPYLTEIRDNQTAQKSGEFRSTEQTTGGDTMFCVGAVDALDYPSPPPNTTGPANGVGRAVASDAARSKFHSFKGLDNISTFGTSGQVTAGKQALYMGGGTWAYIDTTPNPEVFWPIVDLPNPTYTNAQFSFTNVVSFQKSKRKNATYLYSLTEQYSVIGNNMNMDGTGSGVSNLLIPFPVGYRGFAIQPLQIDGGVKVLMTLPVTIGSTDPWGNQISDNLFCKWSIKEEVPGFFALPKPANCVNNAVAAFQLVTVTPAVWIGMGGVFWTPTPTGASTYFGGDLVFYKTTDAGASWTISGPLAVPTLTFNIGLDATPPTSDRAEGYGCRRNLGIAAACNFAQWCIVTPDIYVVSFPTYGPYDAQFVGDVNVPNFYDQNTGKAFNASWYRTTNGGTSWNPVDPVTLIETQLAGWAEFDPQLYMPRDMTYLGNGVLVGIVRAGLTDARNKGAGNLSPQLVWNLIRSVDYGATWTCIPKVGLPAAALWCQMVGTFKVQTKRTSATPGSVLLTIWGGDGYYVYESIDGGLSWRQDSLLAKSRTFYPMDVPGDFYTVLDGSSVTWSANFRNLQIAGTDDAPALLDPVTPWRFNSTKAWVAE